MAWRKKKNLSPMCGEKEETTNENNIYIETVKIKIKIKIR